MSAYDGPRWPVEPLLALLRLTRAEASKHYGWNYRTLIDPRGLTDATADRYALQAGYMPHAVWPEWEAGAVEVIEAHERWERERAAAFERKLARQRAAKRARAAS